MKHHNHIFYFISSFKKKNPTYPRIIINGRDEISKDRNNRSIISNGLELLYCIANLFYNVDIPQVSQRNLKSEI